MAISNAVVEIAWHFGIDFCLAIFDAWALSTLHRIEKAHKWDGCVGRLKKFIWQLEEDERAERAEETVRDD